MMNNRARSSQQIENHPFRQHRVHKADNQGSRLRGSDKARTNEKQANREKKSALLQDVDRLKKKLRDEENIHRALQRALNRPLGSLPRLPPYLPPNMLKLVAEIAVLEEEVVRLEEQVVTYRQDLYVDNVLSCSNRKLDIQMKNSERNFSRATTTEQPPSEAASVSVARTASTTLSDLSSDQYSLSQGGTASTSTTSDISTTSTSDQTGQSFRDSSGNGKAKSNETHCNSTREKTEAVTSRVGRCSSSLMNQKAGLNVHRHVPLTKSSNKFVN